MAKTKTVPVPGDLSHNLGFHTAIGSLVIAWANTESVYLAYLQVLLDRSNYDTAIIWHAQKSTAARLDLIGKLARSRLESSPMLRDAVLDSIAKFRGFSSVRNFFCHAVYSYDGEAKLDFAHGTSLTQDEEPLKFDTKPMDAGTANEIIDTAGRLPAFSEKCWDLAEELDRHFGTQHVMRPKRQPK